MNYQKKPQVIYMFKSYACLPENSKGRLYPEKKTPYRNEFARDRDRIIHSNGFRRLQYKTQVFVNHEGDHYRNRLTHSMEVSSIARSICKALGLCEDLAESVALAHDLGHTPFGHAGERMLNECMQNYGGFSHNAHAFKILTKIEQKYAAYHGLNLSWEVLEGIVKHNGRLEKTDAYAYIFEYDQNYSLDLKRSSSAEAQIAALSDDIAYICHDLEDSVRAKIITQNDLEQIPLLSEYIKIIRTKHSSVDNETLIYEVVRKLMHYLIDHLLSQTNKNIAKYQIKSEEDVRNLSSQLVEFTKEAKDQIKLIKDFLTKKVYKHHYVASITLQGKNVIKYLFELYNEHNDLLPPDWRQMLEQKTTKKAKMSVVADYIAGMTDRYAIKQYQTFYNLNFANTEL